MQPRAVTYFERDFDFETHAMEVEASWDPSLGGGPAPEVAVRMRPKTSPDVDGERHLAVGASETIIRSAPSSCEGDGESTRRGPRSCRAAELTSGSKGSTTEAQAGTWDDFHRQHKGGTFFKERRYLLAEFPCLASAGRTTSVLEIGCGSGSSCLPVLRANPTAAVIACDFSAAAVECARRAVADADAQLCVAAADPPTPSFSERFCAFVCDPAVDDLAAATHRELAKLGLSSLPPRLDAVLMVFVLSAVPLDDIPRFLASVFRALKPGGVVCFRDYGVYDLPMLRFPPDQRLGDRLYVRGDGTLAHFFTVEDVRRRFEEAGFVEGAGDCEAGTVGIEQRAAADAEGRGEEEDAAVRYCCVHNENKRKGIVMRRVFVHGTWTKPLASSRSAGSE